MTIPTSSIDMAALRQLLDVIGGDVADLRELIDSFLEDAPEQLVLLMSAMQASDHATVKRQAHTMKSTARDFGATSLADLCATLEKAAANGSTEGLEPMARDIADQLERAVTALSSLKAGRLEMTLAPLD